MASSMSSPAVARGVAQRSGRGAVRTQGKGAECARNLGDASPPVNTGACAAWGHIHDLLHAGSVLRWAQALPKQRSSLMEAAMRERINNDLKTAMKAGEKLRVGTLRLVNSAIKSADIDARPSGKDKISDADILSVLTKMIKQRRDSVEQYQAGGRQDCADQELAEIAIIEGYLPKQMSEAETKAAIAATIKEVGAASVKDMGKVMAALK